MHFNNFDMKHILHLKRNHVRFYDSMLSVHVSLTLDFTLPSDLCKRTKAIKIRVLLKAEKLCMNSDNNLELSHRGSIKKPQRFINWIG